MALNYVEWRAGEAKRRAAIEPFMGDADQVQRARPRSSTEATSLRTTGTPERLIGPVRSG